MAERHSVIIPLLNGARHVGEALASALAQLGPDDEVIVVDNGSLDDSAALVGRHGDARVTLLHEPRRGPAAARNHGVRHSSGTLISFLDHDDLWPEGRQQGLLDVLSSDPAADAAYGRTIIRFETEPDLRIAHLDGQHIPAMSLHPYIFRRALIERVGPMDESMIFGEDQDYIVRLRAAGMRCAVYDGFAAIYRRHATNMTQDRTASTRGNLHMIAQHIGRKRRAAAKPDRS
jgi:glycosyltransferase involved in cell wall biosynthesis